MAQVLTNAYKLVEKSEHTFVDVDRKSWSNKAISAVQSNKIALEQAIICFHLR